MTHTVHDRLVAYAGLLATWTRRINLVSRADAAQLWPRHIDDSLRLLPLIPPGTDRGLDLGSGAGLPGLVLAIASGIPFDLVESDKRKAAFLTEAARVAGAPVTVHAVRIETMRGQHWPLITARALAPLPALLDLAAPLLAPGGTMLLPKGAGAADEVETARRTWSFALERHGPADRPILAVRAPEPARLYA